jgi:hypothetical protein
LITSLGSDPGPFCEGRYGIYIREYNLWIIFFVFDGTGMHSGFSPSVDSPSRKKWLAIEALNVPWSLVGPQDRCAFVNYYSLTAAHRLASLSISRPLHFGNQGATVPHKVQQRTFCNHGAMVLGNQDDCANRLGREMAFQLFNGLREAKLKLNISMAALLALITYEDEDGQEIALKAPDYDVVADAELVHQYRGYYSWYRQLRLTNYVRISKAEFSSVQTWLHMKNADTLSFPLTERHAIIPRTIARYSGKPDHVVRAVLGRRQKDGKVCIYHCEQNLMLTDIQIQWLVQLEEELESRWITEQDAPW